MVGHAKSQAAKAFEHCTLFDDALDDAVALYQKELQTLPGKKQKGARRCAEEIIALYHLADKHVTFSHQILLD
jgi:hypothetical protein